jgi:8-oxo-dGTP diphosphatase
MTKNRQTGIFKVGGIIVNDGKLLVVRKVTPDNRVEYIIPGGRAERSESHRETLARELQEELGVKLVEMEHFGSFDEVAVFENIPIHMEVYYVNISGTPTPHSEIKEYVWIDREYESKGIRLGSVLAHHVVPGLIKRGRM